MYFENKDIYEKLSGIYMIQNNVNNKIYIGQTSESFLRRFLHHSWTLQNKKHSNKNLQSDWIYYGEDSFTFSVIHVIKEDEDIDELERYYIFLCDDSLLYNIQLGGQDKTMKNVKMSDETKEKIGFANKQKMTGKTLSEKTKLKMSETRKNKTQWGRCKLNYNDAYLIKKMIMDGYDLKDISSIMNIDYKIINNIYSSNTYKSVYVEGWELFYFENHSTKKFSEENIDQILTLYNEGKNISEINRITGFARKTIRKYIQKDNPVPSSN